MTKKAVKKVKNSKRLKKLAPEELEGIWNEEIAETWSSLKPQHQNFFIDYLNENYNAAEAYRKNYNELASDKVASSCGNRMLLNAGMQLICRSLSSNRGVELLLIKKAYTDALKAETPIFGDGVKIMDIEDHKTRISAAEKLAKLNGELIEKTEQTVSSNLTINDGQLNDMNGFLERIGQPTIKPLKPEVAKTTKFTAVVEDEVDPFTSVGDKGIGVID